MEAAGRLDAPHGCHGVLGFGRADESIAMVVDVIYKREANDKRARGRGVVVPQARYYTRWKVWMSLGIDPEVQVLQHRSATHWQR